LGAILLGDKKHKPTRRRPELLRALGEAGPPQTIEIDGNSYQRTEIFKHDSWAATALYQGADGKVVCKFNRQQPIFGLPMKWLGQRLAQREVQLMRAMDDVPNIPDAAGEVVVNRKSLPFAAARRFIEGHPLGNRERVGDDFFPKLKEILALLHARHYAYVDLHKRENIIVGDNGEPYLIDFQISLHSSGRWPGRKILEVFQRADDYHLLKHFTRCRPDLFTEQELANARRRPKWIRAHRVIAVPFRELRRRLLVLLGVRRGKGSATTEHDPEDAVRRQMARDKGN